MMKLSQNNTMIAEIFYNMAQSEDDLSFTGNDYDGMTYKIELDAENKIILASFAFETFTEIHEIVGDFFFKKFYEDCPLEKTPAEGYDFTFRIDISSFTKLPKVPSGATPEEKIEIKKQREEIRNQREAFLLDKKKKMSRMRRNFFAAPFLIAMENMEKKCCKPMNLGFRADEKIWILPNDKGALSIYFCMKFTDDTDGLIGNLIFQEFEEVRRHVNDAPSFSFFKTAESLPASLIKAFPTVRDSMDKNTIILHMLIFESHMKPERREKTAT